MNSAVESLPTASPSSRNPGPARELRTSSRVDGAAWDASLRALSGPIFHAAAWAECTIAEQPRARPVFYTMVDAHGLVAGLALGFRQASARNITAPFSARCWLDALPAVRDASPAEMCTFIRMIEADSRRAGDVTLRIGSFASPGSEAILGSLGYSLARRLEFALDLTRSEKSLWDGIDIKRRQRIRKAMKGGVEVRELPAEDGVRQLRRLQEASFERIVARGGPSLTKRESSADDPVMALTTRGLGRIVGGFVDGECVTASFFSTYNGLAYYALSGHDSRALASQAPSLVL